MTVRLKLALTLFATGLLTALLVIATVVSAFQRFENETAYRRGQAFLGRVVGMYANVVAMHAENPAAFTRWLRALVLFEPDTELYLLDMKGLVLAKTGPTALQPGTRVALRPVRESIERMDASFVMGDDPERMDAGAVIVAKPVRGGGLGASGTSATLGDAPASRRAAAAAAEAPVAGYLYLVLHTQQLPEGRLAAVRSSFARPVLVLVLAVVALTTLLAALITASVTRPLRQLTGVVATLSQRGLAEGLIAPGSALPKPTRDEFGQLTSAFEMLLDVCRRQWNALRRTDQERREGVSNLSHDLRTPLTASVACLETLETRWQGSPARDDDRRLVEIALRNTHNAARIVRSLGDLAKLDEPEFVLRPVDVDAGELLDDIALRFAEQAARRGVALQSAAGRAESLPPHARIDIELFERAIANLIDNALKFCPRGSRIVLGAERLGSTVEVSVSDDGPGIAAADLPHLFDRFYQVRPQGAPAGGEGGRGLGLAIVKRIVELHGGEVSMRGAAGAGTCVVLGFPAAST